MKKLYFPITVLLLTTLIAACGPSATPVESTPDVAAVRTSAASTVVSQFTLTAAAFTVTVPPATKEPTLEATGTATQPVVAQVTNAEGTTVALCDKYSWDPNTLDVTVPDGTTMSPGQEFVKTWKIKNIGQCTWDAGYKLIFSYGDDELKGTAQPLTAAIAPGEEVDISVQLTAPDLPGRYFSAWTMQNAKGIPFLGNDNKAIIVAIEVQ